MHSMLNATTPKRYSREQSIHPQPEFTVQRICRSNQEVDSITEYGTN